MRHCKYRCKLGVSPSHKNAMLVNMLKNLILRHSLITTESRAKLLCRYIDSILCIAKKGGLSAYRKLSACLRIRKNRNFCIKPDSSKARVSGDRNVMGILWHKLVPQIGSRTSGFFTRALGYNRRGDGARLCKVSILVNEDSDQVDSSKETVNNKTS